MFARSNRKKAVRSVKASRCDCEAAWRPRGFRQLPLAYRGELAYSKLGLPIGGRVSKPSDLVQGTLDLLLLKILALEPLNGWAISQRLN
jgi:hypothetical protein